MDATPRLSVFLENFSPEQAPSWAHLVDWTRTADAVGVDRLALSEHVALGEHLEAYGDPQLGGIRAGQLPIGPDGAWLDPLVTIAYLSAITTRIVFVTRILLAALRRPVVLAKTAATIDVLSGGRLELGVGVGWQREEYAAAGVPFEARGRVLNETLELCQSFWRDEPVTYKGDGLDFERVHQMPKPTREIPIWVSGTVNRGSMDRLARYGSGWIPWGDDAGDVVAGIGRMRDAMRQRGRDPGELEVTAVLRLVRDDQRRIDVAATVAQAPRLLDAGATELSVRFGPQERAADRADDLAALASAVHGLR